MLAIVRIKTKKSNDVLWNYVTKNHKDMERKFDNCVEIMYMTKRMKFGDTSLLIQAGTPDCFGDFISKIIGQIPSVEEIWMFNVMNMKFFYIPEILVDEWQRFSVTIRTPPKKFEETYFELSKLTPTVDAAPVFLAYTFHTYGDNIKLSIVAKDEDAANKYVGDYVSRIANVNVTGIVGIEKQLRLTVPESWKLFVKSNLLLNSSVKPSNENSFFIKAPRFMSKA